MDLSQSGGDPADPILRADLLRRHAPPDDESRHQPPFRLDELDNLGPDPDLCGPQARVVLGGAVDSEQVGVLAADAQHVGGPADVHAVVPVGDATRQCSNARSQARPQPFDRGCNLGGFDAVHGG